MGCVRASAVTRRPRPAYPTKLQVAALPDLLARHQPAAWLTQRDLAAAAGLLIAAAGGCSKSGGAAAPQKVASAKLVPDAPAIVAPLFEHGSGRGATGCVVTSPPVFLSEDEAFEIIGDELRAHGIDPAQRNVKLASTSVQKRRYRSGYDWVAGKVVNETLIFSAPLEVAALDLKHRVAVVFASGADYRELVGPWYREGYWSSVTEFDFRQVGSFIGAQISAKPEGLFVGVFYDPLARCDLKLDLSAIVHTATEEEADRRADELMQRWHQAEERAKTESKRLLREQVRDFVDWLKAQGAI